MIPGGGRGEVGARVGWEWMGWRQSAAEGWVKLRGVGLSPCQGTGVLYGANMVQVLPHALPTRTGGLFLANKKCYTNARSPSRLRQRCGHAMPHHRVFLRLQHGYCTSPSWTAFTHPAMQKKRKNRCALRTPTVSSEPPAAMLARHHSASHRTSSWPSCSNATNSAASAGPHKLGPLRGPPPPPPPPPPPSAQPLATLLLAQVRPAAAAHRRRRSRTSRSWRWGSHPGCWSTGNTGHAHMALAVGRNNRKARRHTTTLMSCVHCTTLHYTARCQDAIYAQSA